MEPALKGYFTFEIVYGVIKKSAKLLRFHSLQQDVVRGCFCLISDIIAGSTLLKPYNTR